VTTSMAITSVTVAAIASPTRSLTGPTWRVSPDTEVWASGKNTERRGAIRSRVMDWKKSLSAPPTKIAMDSVRRRELILYIPHRLFFTIGGHSHHFEKRSGCSENPMQYLARHEPYEQIPPNACVRDIGREYCEKDCSNGISDRKTHEPNRMKPLPGNPEEESIRACHLSFRTRM